MNVSERSPFNANLRAAFPAFCLLLFCANLWAAPEKGRVSGRVLDPQGTPVPSQEHLRNANSTDSGC